MREKLLLLNEFYFIQDILKELLKEPHEELYKDPQLRQNLIDVIETANDLDILDFDEFCRHINTPKPMWSKTQATTGKHIPVY